MFYVFADAFGLGIKKYKQPRKPAQIPTTSLRNQLWTAAAVGQVVLLPAVAWVVYPLVRWLGAPGFTAGVPAFRDVAVQLMLSKLWADVGFYFAHRALHMPELYSRFHKQHHSFKGTIAPAAEFARTRLSSGYCFKGTWADTLQITDSLGARYHDWHHTANVGCYGAEWLDWLCGTMDEFWASEGKRVSMLRAVYYTIFIYNKYTHAEQ
ncbi:fatty acid hydroxylase domain-containing protein [Pycnococcus provasolii]